MSTINFAGKEYTLDDQGFLDPPDQWDERFAEGMAKTLGIRELGERHWHVIRYLRGKFVDEQTGLVMLYKRHHVDDEGIEVFVLDSVRVPDEESKG